METAKDRMLELARYVRKNIPGAESYPIPRPMLVLLDHAIGEAPISAIAASLNAEDGGARWLIRAATSTAYVEVTGLADQAGASEDARLVMRPLSGLRHMTVDALRILDDFSDLISAATWTFEFDDGQAVVLSSAEVAERPLREAIEKLAGTLRDALVP